MDHINNSFFFLKIFFSQTTQMFTQQLKFIFKKKKEKKIDVYHGLKNEGILLFGFVKSL